MENEQWGYTFECNNLNICRDIINGEQSDYILFKLLESDGLGDKELTVTITIKQNKRKVA